MFNLEDYPYLNVKVEVYFRVRNSETWGGIGSVGYGAMSLDGVKNTATFSAEFIENWRQMLAKRFKVPLDNVEFITQEEYKADSSNGTVMSIVVDKDDTKPIEVSMAQRIYDFIFNE